MWGLNRGLGETYPHVFGFLCIYNHFITFGPFQYFVSRFLHMRESTINNNFNSAIVCVLMRIRGVVAYKKNPYKNIGLSRSFI